MYRVIKALNHNAVLAVQDNSTQEFLLIGKGIGFGKKVTERIEVTEGQECVVYSLKSVTSKGKAKELVGEINPKYLEIANSILNEAEHAFDKIDRDILFPLADHIAFAANRIGKGEQISNPLTQDIKVLFYQEYKIAEIAKKLLWEVDQIEVDEDEIGFIALHIHSSICDEEVSSAMQIASAVRECITLIERDMGRRVDIQSISYNRLMNHIKYMAARAITGEELKLNMNDYMQVKFPISFRIARTVCNHLAKYLKICLPEVEIGYLAMHIERVYTEE